MKKIANFDEYIDNIVHGHEIVIRLREIILKTSLSETIKWGAPTYTLNGKNIVGLAAFKSYVGMWFHQGVFIHDFAGVLINANKENTRGLRQWRFNHVNEVDENLVLKYLSEAINNQKQGKEIKNRHNKPIIIPNELNEYLNNDLILKAQFENFSPGKKREFVDYIANAKRKETKMLRTQKIIPLIQQNIGLNDKYRK